MLKLCLSPYCAIIEFRVTIFLLLVPSDRVIVIGAKACGLPISGHQLDGFALRASTAGCRMVGSIIG